MFFFGGLPFFFETFLFLLSKHLDEHRLPVDIVELLFECNDRLHLCHRGIFHSGIRGRSLVDHHVELHSALTSFGCVLAEV